MFIELILIRFIIKLMAEPLNSQDTCTQEDALAIRIGILIIFDAIFPIPYSVFPSWDGLGVGSYSLCYWTIVTIM